MLIFASKLGNKTRPSGYLETIKHKTMKEQVLNFGTFNNWKGYIDMYFSQKDIRKIAKELGVKFSEIKEMTIIDVYKLYN